MPCKSVFIPSTEKATSRRAWPSAVWMDCYGLSTHRRHLGLLGQMDYTHLPGTSSRAVCVVPMPSFREVGPRWRKRPRRHSYFVSLDSREVCEQLRTGEVLTIQYPLSGGEGTGTGESRGWTGKADLSSRFILCWSPRGEPPVRVEIPCWKSTNDSVQEGTHGAWP